ncbi:MAG: alpha-glucan family phosphorylase [Gammaproteobacteria bacterium]|nr:alpha-glucan family phosphorylase [Gammaproteobacteria bacterium]
MNNGTRFLLEVQPRIPERLSRINELANNLLYSWTPQIVQLFERLDSQLWRNCGHNPKVFLRRVDQAIIQQAAEDRLFLEDFDRAINIHDNYLAAKPVAEIQQFLDPKKDLVAYFCAEFGLHESLPIYSGGLGILAGDHCKAVSDLGVPFIGVGLLYRQGYFIQTINAQGNQLAHYSPSHFNDLPIQPAVDAHGREVMVQVDIQDRQVNVKVWRARAGHIDLLLLDTDLPSNNEQDRHITYQLYGGDKHMRIQQEMVLGLGGVRALREMQKNPTVWHINEGHAAFSILERCRELVAQGRNFHSALEQVAAGTVFTTHTPVPAGHDIFSHDLMREYFPSLPAKLQISDTQFLQLGSFPGDPHSFNQTALSLRGSRFHNGVSKIHGGVASKMETYVWPNIPARENPIEHVTNGIHVSTFLSHEWANLFNMRLGAGWRGELRNEEYWESIDDIPDHVYWSTHQSIKQDLFEYLHARLQLQHRRNGCSDAEIERLTKYINPKDTDVLVIGFARRFATYKRATLLFSNPERLARLINNSTTPVIFIFAGKAHPKDHPGQELIRTIHEFSRRPEFEGKIVLAEGYDMALARKLVAGVDVWLNNPEYPMEASGTSGEKAGVNGVINLSVLDGWWGEGYNGNNGWAIKPHGPEFDPAFRDRQEGEDLLSLLEHQVVPLYYSRPDTLYAGHDRRSSRRTPHGFSSDWVRMSKASMKSLIPRFNSERMVMDYVSKLYSKAAKQGRRLAESGGEPATNLAQWKQGVNEAWPKVTIRRLDDLQHTSILAGETLNIQVALNLAGLQPKDVIIECLIETQDSLHHYHLQECHRFSATNIRQHEETIFQLSLSPSLSGLQSYRIRAYPYHQHLSHRFETGKLLWI